MEKVGMVKISAYDAQQLSALRVRLRTANWSALDEEGAFLLRGAFPSALLVPVAAHIAQSISTSPGHTKHLTRSSSNGEQGCYTFLSRAVTPTAVDQLADEVADVLRDRYGCSTVDVLARPSTGDGECLVLHYAQNGINYAHRDQPRGSAYLFQLMVCLSEPQDFDGGEFYVEDAGASARREDGLTRTQLKFERAGDSIVFRAAPGAGRNWHHGSTRVEGPEDACRLVLGIGQPTTPREAVRHSGPVEPNWSSLPEDQYEDAVRSTFDQLTKQDAHWRLSASAFNQRVLRTLGRGEYAIGQRLRVTLSSLRNRLEGEEKKHLCKPTAEDRRKLYNGDNKLIAASLQRFIDRAREAGEEGPGKNVKDNGTSAGGSAEGKAHKKQRLV